MSGSRIVSFDKIFVPDKSGPDLVVCPSPITVIGLPRAWERESKGWRSSMRRESGSAGVRIGLLYHVNRNLALLDCDGFVCRTCLGSREYVGDVPCLSRYEFVSGHVQRRSFFSVRYYLDPNSV